MRWMLRVSAGIGGTASLIWVISFALSRAWTGAALDLLGVGSAALTLMLERQGRLHAASRLILAALFVTIFLSAAFLDVPTADGKRAIHTCFLPLAAMACLLLRDERPYAQYGVIGLCLASFGFFQGADPRWVTAYAIPEALRAPGAWGDMALAMGGLFVALHVLQADIDERNTLEGDLMDGLTRGELDLYYQPQLDSQGKLISAEALLRWHHPSRGFISPAEFIPVAESAGLMPLVGDWVMEQACAQLVRWQRMEALSGRILAVNVSASQLSAPGFADRVRELLRQSGAPAEQLKIELTEGTLAQDVEGVIAVMSNLHQVGIRFSLDDFGTGFSSLSYLQRLPLSQLKIDQSFVRQMMNSERDLVIVRTVVSLGQDLGLNVIAEGVETAEQRAILLAMGCNRFQGYLFSRAVTAAEFIRFAERNQAAHLMQAR